MINFLTLPITRYVTIKGWTSRNFLISLPIKDSVQVVVSMDLNFKTHKIIIVKKAFIGCVNLELKNICNRKHTGQKPVGKIFINILGAWEAYAFFLENHLKTFRLNSKKIKYSLLSKPNSRYLLSSPTAAFLIGKTRISMLIFGFVF